MKIPGPDHPISVTANPRRVQVRFAGEVIADTRSALALNEADYPAVQYIPRQDADMAALTPTDRQTHCPYKGDASYFTLSRAGRTAENAVWSYEDPFPAMETIRGRLAFYPNQVEIIEIDEGGA